MIILEYKFTIKIEKKLVIYLLSKAKINVVNCNRIYSSFKKNVKFLRPNDFFNEKKP